MEIHDRQPSNAGGCYINRIEKIEQTGHWINGTFPWPHKQAKFNGFGLTYKLCTFSKNTYFSCSASSLLIFSASEPKIITDLVSSAKHIDSPENKRKILEYPLTSYFFIKQNKNGA